MNEELFLSREGVGPPSRLPHPLHYHYWRHVATTFYAWSQQSLILIRMGCWSAMTHPPITYFVWSLFRILMFVRCLSHIYISQLIPLFHVFLLHY